MLKFFLPATVAQPGPRWEVPPVARPT